MSEEKATVVEAPPVVEKVKNPKKVAAGKKLAEKNTEYKEYYEKNHAVKEVAEPKTESASSSNTGYFVLIVVVVSGIALYSYKNKKVEKPVRVPPPPPPPKKQDRMFEF